MRILHVDKIDHPKWHTRVEVELSRWWWPWARETRVYYVGSGLGEVFRRDGTWADLWEIRAVLSKMREHAAKQAVRQRLLEFENIELRSP